MSNPLTRLAQNPVIDSDDLYLTGTITANTTGTVLDNNNYPAGGFFPQNFRTRGGKQAYITGIRNAVGIGGSAYATFHLLLDGSRIISQQGKSYGAFPNQLGDPSQDTYLPVRIPIGQSQLIQVTADNSDPANNYDFTIRVLIEYEDFS